jgi:hypothetical protein
MADLNEIQLAKLARELAMNIRNYKLVFADFGIDENDYQQIEKDEFFRRVKEQFTIEWNAAGSTEERLRIGSLAYLEQLTPIITKRAMREDANLSAATDVGKVLMKMAGVGEPKNEKVNTDRFVITINLGADVNGKEIVETYDKSIEINANDTPPTPEEIAADRAISIAIKAKLNKDDSDGEIDNEIAQIPSLKQLRTAGEGEGA